MCGYCFVANYFKESGGLSPLRFDAQNTAPYEADGINFDIEEVTIESPGGKASLELPQTYQEKFIVPDNCKFAEHEGLRELFVAKFIESKFCKTNNSEEVHNFTSDSAITDCVRKSCEIQKRTLLSRLKTSKTLSTIFSDFYTMKVIMEANTKIPA